MSEFHISETIQARSRQRMALPERRGTDGVSTLGGAFCLRTLGQEQLRLGKVFKTPCEADIVWAEQVFECCEGPLKLQSRFGRSAQGQVESGEALKSRK